MDNLNELLPIVDENGTYYGMITRGEAHNGSRVLHPVVHLHVFNSQGELYLQLRPKWKDIQPNRWDTACGGHVSYGESIDEALRREVVEEIGIFDFVPTQLGKYVYDSETESELVYVFMTTYDDPIFPSVKELADGRFWSREEIAINMGRDVFTPNFELEYKKFFGHKRG